MARKASEVLIQKSLAAQKAKIRHLESLAAKVVLKQPQLLATKASVGVKSRVKVEAALLAKEKQQQQQMLKEVEKRIQAEAAAAAQQATKKLSLKEMQLAKRALTKSLKNQQVEADTQVLLHKAVATEKNFMKALQAEKNRNKKLTATIVAQSNELKKAALGKPVNLLAPKGPVAQKTKTVHEKTKTVRGKGAETQLREQLKKEHNARVEAEQRAKADLARTKAELLHAKEDAKSKLDHAAKELLQVKIQAKQEALNNKAIQKALTEKLTAAAVENAQLRTSQGPGAVARAKAELQHAKKVEKSVMLP